MFSLSPSLFFVAPSSPSPSHTRSLLSHLRAVLYHNNVRFSCGGIDIPHERTHLSLPEAPRDEIHGDVEQRYSGVFVLCVGVSRPGARGARRL